MQLEGKAHAFVLLLHQCNHAYRANWGIVGDMGQVPYEFRPNFEQSFLAYEVYEQTTRAFEIIISLDLF